MARKPRSKKETPPKDSQDSECNSAPMDNSSSPPLSSPPTSAVLSDQADQLRIEQLECTRADWDFETMINDAGDENNRTRLRLHFDNDAAFTTQTIKAFGTLAKLIPGKEERDKQLVKLRSALCNRLKGHRPKALGGFRAPPFGDDDARKDKSVRDEVKKLITDLDPKFEDGEDEEDGKEAETVNSGKARPDETTTTANKGEPSKGNTSRQQSTVSEGAQAGKGQKPRQGSQSAVDDEYSHEGRLALEQAILDNWREHRGSIPDHLPDDAYPSGIHVTDWPFDLLEALVSLSNVTRGRDMEDIRAKLDDAFPPTKQYSHGRSLDFIKAARDYYDKGKNKESQTDQHEGRPANNASETADDVSHSGGQQEILPPPTTKLTRKPRTTTATKAARPNPGSQAGQDAQVEGTATAQPSTQPVAPQPAGKRSNNEVADTEPPPKKTKRAATGEDLPTAPVHADPSQVLSLSPADESETITNQPRATGPRIRNATTLLVPSHLSDADKQAYCRAVLVSQIASSERIEGEGRVKIAKEARTIGYASARISEFGSLETAVAEAEIEVERRKRETIMLAGKIMEIAGVVGDGVNKEEWLVDEEGVRRLDA
ncbi:hypothetical protein BU25DRAFT_453688 [Macroventuria anomochaeta]|uniref:Uncharacterized protein n=1 Tax=Macroventuria anomochaeta TaxID=301207 RepID=A0ACB6SJV6_9PLEO|nr:uncharacterized protein BU25DRAFT_453688 [Macroventuria anomochaeta]KAF2633987.1 hypothetical protein BU25DRAFT_453688 [Macroventuria anomochaeta]